MCTHIRPILGLLIATTAAHGGISCYDQFSTEIADENGIPLYGRPVDLYPGRMIVGNSPAESFTGEARIYEFDFTDGWELVTTLDGVTLGEEFGSKVEIENLSVAIMAREANGGLGLVDLYERSFMGGGYSYAGTAYPSLAGGVLTGSMALDGDWLAVPEVSPSGSGSVQLWQRAGDGTWGHRQSIVMGAGANSLSVDLTSEDLVIGNTDADVGRSSRGGRVSIFLFNNEFERWDAYATLGYAAPRTGWAAGSSVAVEGSFVAFAGGGYPSNGWGTAEVELWTDTRGGGWQLMETYSFPESGRGEGGTDNATVWDIDLSYDILAMAWSDWNDNTSGVKVVDLSDGAEYAASHPERLNGGPIYYVAASGQYVASDGMAIGATNRSLFFGPGVDCDENGIDDYCDLLNNGTDLDEDFLLDRCECPGNTNSHVDSDVDSDEVLGRVLVCWGGANGPFWPEAQGDFNGDGACDVLDLLILLDHWGSCPGVP